MISLSKTAFNQRLGILLKKINLNNSKLDIYTEYQEP